MAESADGVKSARRALEILEHLATLERPASFSEIATSLGYPKSSLHGILRTLQVAGWLEPTGHGQYTLGIKTWEVGHGYLRAADLAGRARPFMQRISRELNETVQLAILDGIDNVYIGKVDGNQALVLQSDVGRRLRAYATGIGKVLLAGLGTQDLLARLGDGPLTRYTHHTITSVDALLEELEQVRRQGFAEDNEEYTVGVRCVAVPVYGPGGQVVAGMSVSMPTVRLTRERRDQALALLRDGARDLSHALGHLPTAG